MIVPAMSLSEIKKSVFEDFSGEIKSKIETIKMSQKSRWIRSGKTDFVETILCPSKSKNNWRVTVACKKNGVFTTPYLISYNNVGITASHVSSGIGENALMHFNTHFFKRYKERGKITIEKPEDVVKFFFKKNLALIPCYLPREDGTLQLFVPLNGGVGLGNYHKETDIWEFKTFVDDSLLGQDQKDAVMEIWTNTITELTAEIQKRLARRQGQPELA